ncbi:linear amide C-N hydrolase [Legionella gresilensis]|uniref:linear amide C-N hydrolase n=1 Tax=Legionella gresilensis TaxID=91823 RepID=UPI001040FE20|nr:linear amide C-N hydrolase [Legionella gresilensis]
MLINLNSLRQLTLVCLLASSFYSNACTTIFANATPNRLLVARTMDLYTSDMPLIVAEPRGVEHNGEAGKNSLHWRSKYGTVMVTALHTNAVTDGINEKGLAVHLLYLENTKYPNYNNNLPKISNGMWGKYILDNFATVNEALAGTKNLEIVATEVQGKKWPLHLTIEDATGDSAVIEFIDGKMNVYHGPQYRVVTNEPAYNIQLANLKNYQGFGGTRPLPGDADPISRFVRAATYLKTMPKPADFNQSISDILSVIRSAMVPFGAVYTSESKKELAWPTQWIAIADLTNKTYYFHSTSNPNVIWIALDKVNFAPGAPTLTIDPLKAHKADIVKKLRPAFDL